jgi:hypothetical protein
MHPLDLLKIKFQVATSTPPGGVGKSIYYALRDIYAASGVPGLYRGIGTNIAGNASSWGLYFLLWAIFSSLDSLTESFRFSYTYLKERQSAGGEKQLTPSTFLLCSAEASPLIYLWFRSSLTDEPRRSDRFTHQPNLGRKGPDVHNAGGLTGGLSLTMESGWI